MRRRDDVPHLPYHAKPQHHRHSHPFHSIPKHKPNLASTASPCHTMPYHALPTQSQHNPAQSHVPRSLLNHANSHWSISYFALDPSPKPCPNPSRAEQSRTRPELTHPQSPSPEVYRTLAWPGLADPAVRTSALLLLSVTITAMLSGSDAVNQYLWFYYLACVFFRSSSHHPLNHSPTPPIAHTRSAKKYSPPPSLMSPCTRPPIHLSTTSDPTPKHRPHLPRLP